LFDRAQRQGISYFNYGEAIAGTVPPSVLKVLGVTDKDIGPAQAKLENQKFAHSNLGFPFECYPNDTSIGTDSIAAALTHAQRETFDSSVPAGAAPSSESRFSCFQTAFDQRVAASTVPAFNYLVLPSDHTTGVTPGTRTPRSMVAENDYGLGQIVDPAHIPGSGAHRRSSSPRTTRRTAQTTSMPTGCRRGSSARTPGAEPSSTAATTCCR